MVSVELTAFEPGVTDAGENEHSMPAGRPEQESAIGSLKAPVGLTLICILPDCPAESVRVVGDALRETPPDADPDPELEPEPQCGA